MSVLADRLPDAVLPRLTEQYTKPAGAHSTSPSKPAGTPSTSPSKPAGAHSTSPSKPAGAHTSSELRIKIGEVLVKTCRNMGELIEILFFCKN